MVAARRIIALSVDADQRRVLVEIARSRTEPANRVERAGIILAYLNKPSADAVARTPGVSQPTVTRCMERAAESGGLAALDDRARPRARGDDYGGGQNLAGRAGLGETEAIRLSAPAVDDPPVGGAGARSRAGCRPPEPGAPGPRDGGQDPGGARCETAQKPALAKAGARCYLERRDPEFEPKMAEILWVYREVAMRRAAGGAGQAADRGGLLRRETRHPGDRHDGPRSASGSRRRSDDRSRSRAQAARNGRSDGRHRPAHRASRCPGQRSPSPSPVHRIPWFARHGLPRGNRDQDHSRQSLRAYFSRNQDLARGPTRRALPVRLHSQAPIVAQPRRGLLCQSRPRRTRSHPRRLQAPAHATPHRIHRRPQPRPGDPSTALSNRRCRLIHSSGNLETTY